MSHMFDPWCTKCQTRHTSSEKCAANRTLPPHILDALTNLNTAYLTLSEFMFKTAQEKGFWGPDPNNPYKNDGEALMLMVTEIAEIMEGIRKPGTMSDKIETFTVVEEEVADLIIRLFDWARGKGIRNLSDILEAKMTYNLNRPFMHGKTC